MADKSDKPPDAIKNTTVVVANTPIPTSTTAQVLIDSTSLSSSSSTSHPQNNDDFAIQPRSTCNCTKISIMLLIHEMKQTFATVPDHIISQYVMDNCHDRLACFEKLEAESEKYPGSVQAYPAALRNTKRPTVPRRIAPSIPNHNHNHKNHPQQHINDPKSSVTTNEPQRPSKQTTSNFVSKKNEVTPSDSKTSDMSGGHINAESYKAKVAPQRPNTLSLSKVPNQLVSSKPTRPAPPPPPPFDNYGHFYNSSRTQSSTDSSESLNVSLNVTVSPLSGRPPPGRPSRHTTAISVHPEHPAFSATGFEPADHHSPRSYTSVNFTLRQPGDSPQSPIDITAGPSLTYSSRSYDARAGYQSHLAITVGGNGGSICASRTRPRNSAGYMHNSRALTENGDNNSIIESMKAAATGLALSNSISNTTTALDKGEI